MPNSSSRDNNTNHVRADYQLIARALPLGPFARIEWNNRSFFVLDGPHHHKASITTEHVSVALREER
ncbi:hypothetical protein [Pseudonocardia sp. DLS-67]